MVTLPTKRMRLGWNPLAYEVLLGLGRRREQQVRQPIREDAVDLLWHRPVPRSKPRFNMHDGDPELRSRERGGYRACHVADDHDDLRATGEQVAFHAHEHRRRLLSVRAPAGPQPLVRLGHSQVAEEDVAHRRVEVLPRVHQARGDAAGAKRPSHGRHLHEVRAGASDEVDQAQHPT